MTMPATATDQARQVLALLPTLRRWVTTRVQLASADLDLSLRQFAALHGIRDGAESPGELARLWQVTPAVLTGIVDRLERRGLVRREVDPNDRRRQRLALTEEGSAASEDVEQALVNELAGQLATASEEELAALGRSIDLLQRTFAALEERSQRDDRFCDGLDESTCEQDASLQRDQPVLTDRPIDKRELVVSG
jgi:DNA-binding MarR family transcriptional regulator